MRILISLILFLCGFNSIAQTDTNVFSDGHVIYYNGFLSEEGNKKVMALITPLITTLYINSRGGEINLGMDLGELVYAYNLDVRVGEYCFSSCANYVFPAGKHKILAKKSQLGWHGGATQKINQDEYPKDKKMKDKMIKRVNTDIERETGFFNKINVNQISTVYGQNPKVYKNESDKKDFIHCLGWDYSLSAMEVFGFKNIILADGQWSPERSFNGKCIHRFEEIDKNII